MVSSSVECLQMIYWIGGGSGAGKSTVARRLAERHGLQLYSTDAAMAEHGRRANTPAIQEFARMSMDERWVNRSPEEMLETFHWFRGDGFECIVEDLRTKTDVLVEGFRLSPLLVKAQPGRAVWLLPSPEFRRAAFASRGSLWDIAGKTSHPEKALHNLLERDRLFTDRLRAETHRENLARIEVEAQLTEAELVDRVAALLGLGN